MLRNKLNYVVSLGFILMFSLTSFAQNDTFQIRVTGADHFPEGARVLVYRHKPVEAVESIEYLKKGVFTKGEFVVEGNVNEVHLITVDVVRPDNDYPFHRLTFPLEPTTINIDFTGQQTYQFKGGKYGKIVINSVNDNKEYKKAWADLLSYKVTDYKDKAQKAEYMKRNSRVNTLKQELFAQQFVINQADPLAKLLLFNAGYFGNKDMDRISEIEDLAMQVGKEHRQSKVAMLGVKMIRENSAARKTVGVGAVIKDFEAQDLSGKTFHLANVLTKNKYVLVEFWASWCGPCRGEIPHMKKAYSHFKEKGFEIVSFTLDHKKEKWEKASKEEQIPWINTGDLLARTSPVVKLYGVSGVPANYLVEAKTGKIVAKNLRGEKLDQKLEELLK